MYMELIEYNVSFKEDEEGEMKWRWNLLWKFKSPFKTMLLMANT